MRVVFSSLDGQWDILDVTVGKCCGDDLLDLTVADGDVELVLMNVKELSRLLEQALKLL